MAEEEGTPISALMPAANPTAPVAEKAPIAVGGGGVVRTGLIPPPVNTFDGGMQLPQPSVPQPSIPQQAVPQQYAQLRQGATNNFNRFGDRVMMNSPQSPVVPNTQNVPTSQKTESFSEKTGGWFDKSTLKEVALVVIIFLVVNMKFVYKQMAKFFPSVITENMDPSLCGLLFNSLLAGLIFFVIKRFIG